MVGAASLFDDRVGVLEDLINGHGIHFATVIVAGLDSVLQVATSGLRREIVGDDVASAVLLLDPGLVGHGDPDGAVVDREANISGVGMAGGDCDDGPLPLAAEVFAGPAVGHSEVFIHGLFQLSSPGLGWARLTLEAHP